jgi:hypothetical protein
VSVTVQRLRAVVPYALAGAAYTALGAWEPRFLLSWAEGILFVLLAVWAIPAAWRRLRR